MRTTMKISQSAWDSMWENSEGNQTVMFDAETGTPIKSENGADGEETALQEAIDHLMNTIGLVVPSYYAPKTSCFYTPKSTK